MSLKYKVNLDILRPVPPRFHLVSTFFSHIMVTPGVSCSRQTSKLSHIIPHVGSLLLPSIAHVFGDINRVSVAFPVFGGVYYKL